MKRTIIAAACVGMLAACNPEGANDRQTGAVGSEAGAADSPGMGMTGTGTTGAQTGVSGDTRVAGGGDTGAMGTTGAAGGALSSGAILSQLAVANETEIQEAQLAQRQAQSAGVKELARTLERDHSAGLKKVQAAQKTANAGSQADARANAVADAQHTGDDLAGKTGADFDKAFLERQKTMHEENIRKLEGQFLPAAQDAEVRSLIQGMLPTLRQHLASIERLQDRQ